MTIMKNSIMNNRKNNGIETAKTIGKGIGEGLGVIALLGLTFASAYAEVEADDRASHRLYDLDSNYQSLKREFESMSISKFPYGYYNGIRSDFESVSERYSRVRTTINHYGMNSRAINEIKNRYGYSFLDRLESDISSLSIRI